MNYLTYVGTNESGLDACEDGATALLPAFSNRLRMRALEENTNLKTYLPTRVSNIKIVGSFRLQVLDVGI